MRIGMIPGARRTIARVTTAASGAADTNENVLATLTIPGGTVGPNDELEVTAGFTITNSANNKTLKIRLGGAAGTAYYNATHTTSATVEVSKRIRARGSVSSQIGASPTQLGPATSTSAKVTSSVNMAADTTIVIQGQKALAGETITLEYATVELIKGP